MDRERTIEILKRHERDIRARGVTRLALFGSTGRDEARPESDVDILIDIDRSRKFSLIDLSGVRLYLCDLLGREVEVAQREGLKPFLKDNILAGAVEVFPKFGRREPVPGNRPMNHRNPRQRLQDMLDAINAIEKFVAGKSFSDYAATDILRAAVERNIEIVSEASRHVPDELKKDHSQIPWRQIADIGNILRHGYEIVDQKIVWNVASRDLSPLKAAVEGMIRKVEKGERG
ncbi:MAG: HepT-like ribonuclease domain-containing protein [Alphaproteobacteria bacterium]